MKWPFSPGVLERVFLSAVTVRATGRSDVDLKERISEPCASMQLRSATGGEEIVWVRVWS